MVKRTRVLKNDRLSRIPDGILSQILSSLDTKHAVQTCILSKRWKYLWTSLPSLNFYSTSFKKLSSFNRFVQHVLTLRDHSVRLTNFNFSRRGSMNWRLFNKVINFTQSHNVENLYFHFEDIGDCGFPNYLYSSYSLKKLQISFGYSQSLRKPLYFEELTILNLKVVSFIKPDLFSSCPKLVELTIVNCSFDLDTLTICAPQLARLNISYCSGRENGCKIALLAPKLTLFTLDACHPLMLSKNDLPLVDTQIINLHVYLPRTPDVREKKLTLDLISMLHCLHKARSVILSFDTIESIYDCDDLLNNSPDAEIVMDFPRCQYCFFVNELDEFANKRNSRHTHAVG
ncbi:unnamed protein product [Ilex paraguariensis]|uniref:F-box domain-containing protein n=1 Tax=Ilex paraguariensis TaxID=185542 RepID=A0ABC8RPC9_9AQUA